MKSNKYVKEVVSGLKKAAKLLEKHEQDVTKKELADVGVTDWTMKHSGGITSIKNAYFPLEEKDLAGIYETKNNKAYISKLESIVGKKEFQEQTLAKEITKVLKTLPKIKAQTLRSTKKAVLKRELIAMLNDTHIGLIVDPEHIGNTNGIDFKECGRRFAFFMKEVVNYKPHARHETKKLHIILNGDILAGIIHGLETKTIHLLTHQIAGAIHIIGHAIAHAAKDFQEIEVHGIAGNHDRVIHKDNGKRPVAEVFDSYANIIYFALSAMFKDNKQISFNFPKTPYGFINLPAGRAMYAHGDHVFSKAIGNPGRAINVKALSESIKDFNAGEVAKGNQPVKLLLLGHVHVFCHFITNDGVEVYIAPSLSGTDDFSHSLTINTSFIGQAILESTNNFILGDSRLVRLKDADKDASLDNIIPEYKKQLKWEK